MNARTASGATTAVMSTDQMTVVRTGCCRGRAASAGAGGTFPQSSRMDWTSELMGFHSAMVRSHGVMPSVGAKVLARKVTGKIVVNIRPLTASGERIEEPTRTPTQIIA